MLKALNEIGLKTRSHNIDSGENVWVCILMDNITDISVRDVYESSASRTKYNGKKVELEGRKKNFAIKKSTWKAENFFLRPKSRVGSLKKIF